MMAQATEKPVDVAAHESSLIQPAATTSDQHNADPSSNLLNGSVEEIENKQIAEIVDELVNSAEASVSGSDTELSKAERSKNLGEKSHVRSSSTVKKPQSFKPVSVNRSFLGSKVASSTSRPESAATSASTTPQPTATPSSSRLKLVAKSGSNLGGSTKTLSTNGKPANAPDGGTVWNRNRAPVQPEPKKLSDEELMKIGIHMADRLGPEDTKGHSNWADIDDDDDEEWAPETITWTDGTKITLPQAAESAPSPEPVPAVIHKQPLPIQNPKSPVPTPSATGSPSVKSGVLASGKGLVLKGAPEKPTLVTKPPAPPAPVKSPWAPLPPVEKMPPVSLDTPNAPPPSRYPLRDGPNAKSMTPSPTKEIAADDFSRSAWRGDAHLNANKELFIPQSGRYEPVSDRRGSRNDIHGRQPAVLQRPHNDQQGPPGPSAAFQTSRNNGQEGPYGRRRGSSNVSGGSGILGHRLEAKQHAMAPPSDMGMAHPRSGSNAGGGESPVSTRTFSPANGQQTQRGHPLPYQARPSPSQTHAVPHPSQPVPETTVAEPDPEEQKRYMLQRREEAIKRRLEEEAREEEARKARIAEKLKAMGPAPERKSSKKDKEDRPLPSVARRDDIPASLAAKSSVVRDQRAEPTSPVPQTDKPEATSENPIGTASSKTTAVTAPATDTKNDSRVTGGPQRLFSQPDKATTHPSHRAHAPPAANWPESSQHQERYPSWGGGSRDVSRIWGAPGNDRTLGNGTFNADMGPLPDSHPTPVSSMSHRPPPIGPPARAAPQGQPLRAEPPATRLAPIGPPRGRTTSTYSQEQSQASSNPWKSFDVKADDRRRAFENRQKLEAMGDVAPAVADTWRSVEVNNDGKRGSIDSHVKVHSELRSKRDDELRDSRQQIKADGVHPDFGQQIPVGPAVTAAPGNTQTRGGSRFFPVPKESQSQTRTKSPTPPPPTADGHPAYDGDVTRPHVALPPQRPRVKLPPSAQSSAPGPIAPPKPASFAAAVAAPTTSRAPSQGAAARPVSRGKGYGGVQQKPHEIASQENWQDKINSLMGKKATSPAKAMPVDSSSRTALEYTPSYDPATVSLPVLSPSFSETSDESSITSKEMAEECFGEQEMGSLPAVRLPLRTPDAAWHAVPPNWNPAPAKLRVDATVAEALRFPLETSNGKSVFRISTPGMAEPKTVTMPYANNRSGSNPRRGGSRGTSRRTSRGDHTTTSSSGRSAPSRGGRPFRPRTENWGRQASSTSAAQAQS